MSKKPKKKLLDDILGTDPSPPPHSLDAETMAFRSKVIHSYLKNHLDRYRRGDRLMTVKQLCEVFADKPWCPKEPDALTIALSRAHQKPAIKGSRGRSRPSYFWKFEVMKALKRNAKRKKSRKCQER
ncbi:MAG: hypothetical protein KIS92_03220 [Planctomycetota bacterium]|nr:hypothetical protein [Planctomycetota bacterium]